MRIGRRRLSTKPENIKRRLTNRVTQVVAALVIAGGYYVWNTWIAPAAPGDEATMVEPDSANTRASQQAESASSGKNPGSQIDELFESRRSNEMVTLTATVAQVLADDNDGSRHQRFILELPSGLSVLIAHNIDLAPRVPGLGKGDRVTVRGEYEWNERGGVIHWTHHDPAGRHQAGWIELNGNRYE